MKQQCEVLLKALKRGPMTTKQIRDSLGIGMPATRIFELRAEGHVIEKEMVRVRTRDGCASVAKYTLVEEHQGRAAA